MRDIDTETFVAALSAQYLPAQTIKILALRVFELRVFEHCQVNGLMPNRTGIGRDLMLEMAPVA